MPAFGPIKRRIDKISKNLGSRVLIQEANINS